MRRWWMILAFVIAALGPVVASAVPGDTALRERVGLLHERISDLQRLSALVSRSRDDAGALKGAELERDLIAANQIAVAAQDDVRGIRLRLFPYATDDTTTALDILDRSLGRARDAFMSMRKAARAGDRAALGIAADSVTDASGDFGNAFTDLLRALDSPRMVARDSQTTDGTERGQRSDGGSN
jgi:hypothetical protein